MKDKISYKEYIRFNTSYETYGNCKRIRKSIIQSIIISLGVLIPVIVPLPLMIILSRLIKKDLVVRYE